MTEPKFIHYSDCTLKRIIDAKQIGRDIYGGAKPNGLWFSVDADDDNGWEGWCKSNNLNLDRLTFKTEIVFAKHAKILTLDSSKQIDAFTKKYGTRAERATQAPPSIDRYCHEMDWQSVATLYDAIIIAPYCYERRLTPHTMWFYGWDIASGVVWRAKAVKELRPVNW